MATNGRKDASKNTPRPPLRDRGWFVGFMQGLSITASVAIFAGLAAGVILGVPQLQDRLAERTQAKAISVVFDWPPIAGAPPAKPGEPPQTWVPPQIRDELLATAHNQIEGYSDPFSQTGLKRVAEALQQTGWFEKVDRVKRERDRSGAAVVRVEATWRKPAAVVRKDDVDYLVARDGTILPVAYPQGTSPLKVILSASQQPKTEHGKIVHGQVWPGREIQAALEVLALVGDRPWADQVAAIDTRDYGKLRRLSLVTTRDTRVVWGGAPSDVVPGELGPEIKLSRIEALAARFGGKIDAGHRLVEVFGPITTVDNSATADASAVTRGR